MAEITVARRAPEQSTPSRRLVAAGRKTGSGPFVPIPSPQQRLAQLEVRHGFGRLAPSAQDLLFTAAAIAEASTLPADRPADERIVWFFLRRAAAERLAPLQRVATIAERVRDRILFAEPSQATHEAREDAERRLSEARNRVYVARRQADVLVADTVDTVARLLSRVSIGELAGLLRLVAEVS
jgi:hypothetical protein